MISAQSFVAVSKESSGIVMEIYRVLGDEAAGYSQRTWRSNLKPDCARRSGLVLLRPSKSWFKTSSTCIAGNVDDMSPNACPSRRVEERKVGVE